MWKGNLEENIGFTDGCCQSNCTDQMTLRFQWQNAYKLRQWCIHTRCVKQSCDLKYNILACEILILLIPVFLITVKFLKSLKRILRLWMGARAHIYTVQSVGLHTATVSLVQMKVSVIMHTHLKYIGNRYLTLDIVIPILMRTYSTREICPLQHPNA